MKPEIEPVSIDPSEDGKTIIRLSVSKEAAGKLLQAFANEKLADFGVTDVNVVSVENASQSVKKWGKTEIDKRAIENDGTPPLP